MNFNLELWVGSGNRFCDVNTKLIPELLKKQFFLLWKIVKFKLIKQFILKNFKIKKSRRQKISHDKNLEKIREKKHKYWMSPVKAKLEPSKKIY